MTKDEFDDFCESHKDIEWQYDEEKKEFAFRNICLDWYLADKNRATVVTEDKIKDIKPDDLLKAINSGLEVEQMTRITGYFAKVASFNKGKMGELKDRHKDSSV
jgi:hypothetical protein